VLSHNKMINNFFFFQAEDGIRDRNVTGVQTCALPILKPTFSISFVRIAFWAFTIFGLSGTTEPSKYFFKVATPLLIHNNVGSSFGTSETLGSMVCPFSIKNCKNNAIVSAEVLCFIHRSCILISEQIEIPSLHYIAGMSYRGTTLIMNIMIHLLSAITVMSGGG